MSDTSTSGDTGQARSEPCIREGATPAGLHDPDDPQPDTLIIDCRAHGEIGRVSFGPCEFERAEALFAEHVADTGQAREPRPVYPQVWCDDSSGPNGIGGTCVLGPGHLHRDGLGGEWPVDPSGDTVQAPNVAADDAESPCLCGPDLTGECIDIRPDCPQHGFDYSVEGLVTAPQLARAWWESLEGDSPPWEGLDQSAQAGYVGLAAKWIQSALLGTTREGKR